MSVYMLMCSLPYQPNLISVYTHNYGVLEIIHAFCVFADAKFAVSDVSTFRVDGNVRCV